MKTQTPTRGKARFRTGAIRIGGRQTADWVGHGRTHSRIQLRMIRGAHVLIYSQNAEADRAFLRDTLKLPSVDAGQGWLIFALPPGEVSVHPSEENDQHELYLTCDDVAVFASAMKDAGITCSTIEEQRWGFAGATDPAGRRKARRLSAQAPAGAGLSLAAPQRRGPFCCEPCSNLPFTHRAAVPQIGTAVSLSSMELPNPYKLFLLLCDSDHTM